MLTELQVACSTIAQQGFQQRLVLRLRIQALRVESKCLTLPLPLEVLVTLFLEILCDLWQHL